jgi:CheY-like chemotaxis protein
MSAERILVVDDDELVRTGLALDLEDEGYTVSTAASAEAAINMLEHESVELILSDLVMAEMDGLGLLSKARQRHPHIGFIVITGHGTVNRAMEAMRRGANDFIQKPAEPRVIRQRVRRLLDDVRLRRTMMEDRRKQRERRDVLQKKMLRDQRMITVGRLADGVSAYLDSTLQPLLACVNDLPDLLPEDHVLAERLDELSLSRRKAESLISDLKILGFESHPNMQPLQLETLVHHALTSDEVQQALQRADSVRLKLNLHPDLPAVLGSKSGLTTLVYNMVLHLLDGMPAGGQLEIDVHAETADEEDLYGEQHGRYVVLRMADTSPYPPVQDPDRMFEPFQARQVGDTLLSTGLTLSVVYRIIQEHHGYIDVEPRQGGGHVYCLAFPVAPKQAEATTAAPTTQSSRQETILVLDDNPEHRDRATAILQRLGYHVLTAANGAEAIELIRGARRNPDQPAIDLALLDLILGDAFDGLETYKEIIQFAPNQKAILVSGFADFSRIVEARQLGLTQCLQKPYRLDILGQAIRAELDR